MDDSRRICRLLLPAFLFALALGACTGKSPEGKGPGHRAGAQRSGDSPAKEPLHPVGGKAVPPAGHAPPHLAPGEERHLRNIKMLTFGGDNAEAYFSFDNRRIIFQSTSGQFHCDQIFTMDVTGENVRLVSPGTGQTTCAYWMPDGERIIFASTHLSGPECLPKPDRAKREVWVIHHAFEIFSARPDGSDLKRLTSAQGYDAEGTIGPDGRIVFTSMRDGDLEIYVMDADGSNQTRLTDRLGYDGGPFFTHDGKKIVWRTYYPETEAQIEEYKQMIERERVGMWPLGIWIMNADGTGKRRLTPDDGKLYWAPFPHPDGKRIFFASNMLHEGSRYNFELYLLHMEDGSIERITYDESFDAFPMISGDGKRFLWCSNRQAPTPRSTNVFIADWVD